MNTDTRNCVDMSEIDYTETEINDTWSGLNSDIQELETYQNKTDEPKEELIIRIRDKVEILVKAGKIQI